MAEDTEKKTTRQSKPKVPSLYGKLLEVRKSVDYLQKATTGGQFNYTSSSQVLSAVRQKMNDLGILLTMHVTGTEVTSTPNRNGVLSHFTELALIMTWIDTETGEKLELPWYGQGVDLAGEKGVGKALTYAEKYFILKQFNIPTDKDDPDAFQDKNLPQTDVKAMLIEKLAVVSTQDEVKKIWNDNVKLKTDKDFIEAVKKAGARVKPKAEPEPEQETDKEEAKAEGDA